MRRILIIIALLIIVGALAMMLSSEVRRYAQSASVIVRSIGSDKVEAQVRKHFNEDILTGEQKLSEDAKIDIRTAYINTDTREDIIATVKSTEACGSGGCLTALMVQTSEGLYEAIPFGYAVKELVVESSITNQMHDITINNDEKNRMVWDGERYTLNSY